MSLTDEPDAWLCERPSMSSREELIGHLHFKLQRTETQLAASEAAVATLRQALSEALDEWEYACEYKGEYLSKKHGDMERITELRALSAVPAPAAP